MNSPVGFFRPRNLSTRSASPPGIGTPKATGRKRASPWPRRVWKEGSTGPAAEECGKMAAFSGAWWEAEGLRATRLDLRGAGGMFCCVSGFGGVAGDEELSPSGNLCCGAGAAGSGRAFPRGLAREFSLSTFSFHLFAFVFSTVHTHLPRSVASALASSVFSLFDVAVAI